jgi:hypothetical protein
MTIQRFPSGWLSVGDRGKGPGEVHDEGLRGVMRSAELKLLCVEENASNGSKRVLVGLVVQTSTSAHRFTGSRSEYALSHGLSGSHGGSLPRARRITGAC